MRPSRTRPRHAGQWLLALASWPGPTPPQEAGPPPSVSGSVHTRYRGRFSNTEGDHDLYATVDLSLTDPAGHWTGSLLARGAFDLDGRDAGEDGEFFGLLDAYDHRFQPQLFHAFVDVASEDFARLRFGRQTLYDTPLTLVLDGFLAELEPLGRARASLGAFAGVGEHLYESSDDGDLVFGAFASTALWSGAEVRADWMRLEDARLGVEHENDLLGLVLSQDVPREERDSRLEARFTALEGDSRDLRLSASHVDAARGFSLQSTLYSLLRTQRELAAPLDPFSDSLFELFPYTQVGMSASKDWDVLALLLGADLRRVEEADDEGSFNRDFERYHATGTVHEGLPVILSLTGELWRATDTDFETWGAAASREFEGGFEATLGSYYALYEYDPFTGSERDHVRNTYLDVRWKRDRQRRWSLRYEFEDSDFDQVQEVRVDYAWGF